MHIPLVFVHGIRLSGVCWTEQRSFFSARAVATPDLPGHGTRRGERFTLDAAVDVVERTIDDVGGRAVVVGHSMGGYVGIATAARHPDKVAGLVAAGCSISPTRLLCLPYRGMRRALSVLPDDGDAVSARLFRRLLPPGVAEPIIAAGIATDSIPDVMTALQVDRPVDSLQHYPGTVLLINGRHDHFRLGERQFVNACPRGSLTVVPHAGHYLPMTRGAVFARLIAEFSDGM
ncbi:alpha/beta fold hydrolase [Spelaeicoccus albus]|uniref:Pimeloyl-ACP methyl ester carboxylesterase n=1 Tax=Spelaeicoccus albus TaxID=1280376 RepID=A0A7Z0AA27_9MICO|nr:alpha/beta hydrolase [Spelaeicoccus albus]NYI66348.1 pimeloyl-ACP methyl ester carboxylesterase [Spelaeicoccus albus]